MANQLEKSLLIWQSSANHSESCSVQSELEASGVCLSFMTDTERQYAQIEKEPPVVTWACEKFADFIPGCHFETEMDHKPLVPLLSTWICPHESSGFG